MTCRSRIASRSFPWPAVTDLRADARHPPCHPASERITCAQEPTHGYCPW